MSGVDRGDALVRALPVVFVLIWIAAVLTVVSMVYYMQKAIPEIRARVK